MMMEQSHVTQLYGKKIVGFRAGNLKSDRCDWIILFFEDGSEFSLSGYSEPIEIELTSRVIE